MTKPDILTIGIPTYNRKEAILSCLDHLYEKKIHLKARILVIDNASEDQSYQIIHKKYSHVFDIYKNKYNIGFAGNTIELFKNCSTEYLLWLSDEDIIKLKVADKDQLALVSLDSRFRAFDSSISLIIKKASCIQMFWHFFYR